MPRLSAARDPFLTSRSPLPAEAQESQAAAKRVCARPGSALGAGQAQPPLREAVLLSRGDPGGCQGSLPCVPGTRFSSRPAGCRWTWTRRCRTREGAQPPADALCSSSAWKWQEIISVPPEESFTDILHGAVSAQNYLLPFRTFKIISIAEEN